MTNRKQTKIYIIIDDRFQPDESKQTQDRFSV